MPTLLKLLDTGEKSAPAILAPGRDILTHSALNRGGEKISPREVDEVLIDHPAVLQAVTFAVPHPGLGEEVAAAVVLREQRKATAKELREFLAARLADYKVPRKIVVVDEISKGPTGKLQHIGLASKLGLA